MNYKKILFFTGSGISVDSGLKTYRSKDGIWNNYKINDVATKKAIYSNLNEVNCFFNTIRNNIKYSKPNKAHFIISDISKKIETKIITQNIDDLHERSGSKNVIHIHGSIFESIDIKRKGSILHQNSDIKENEKNIENNFLIRPNIVLFNENAFHIDESLKIIKESDLIIIIGTSLSVEPANNIVFENNKATIIIIDIDKNILNKVPEKFKEDINKRIFLYNDNSVNGLIKLKKEILKMEN